MPGQRLQTVNDVQLDFAGYRDLVIDEEVVVAVNGSADGVFHRHDPVRCALVQHGVEDLVERLARQRFRVRGKKQGRRLAVSARFTLIGNPHSNLRSVISDS